MPECRRATYFSVAVLVTVAARIIRVQNPDRNDSFCPLVVCAIDRARPAAPDRLFDAKAITEQLS